MTKRKRPILYTDLSVKLVATGFLVFLMAGALRVAGIFEPLPIVAILIGLLLAFIGLMVQCFKGKDDPW